MLLLIAGLLLFVGIHSSRIFADSWRKSFIDSYGEKTWKLVVTLLSVVGLVLIAYGYGLSRADPVFLWNPPLWTRHLALLFTWLAFILLAAAYVPHNHFKAKLGHPMYAGIKIWAFAHLLANGRLGDVLLFGVILIWAILGFTRSRKRDRREAVIYPSATLGKTFITVLAGSIVWLAFAFWLHVLLIGVPPI